MQTVLSVLVENQPGVLVRVASLFSRRGYNIDSLTVSETENSMFSRMTIVASGSHSILEQIQKQLEKLEDVVEVHRCSLNQGIVRELALISVVVKDVQRAAIVASVDIFRGRIIDAQADTLTIELTGSKDKVDAFVDLMRPYGIQQLTRTGLTALSTKAEKFDELLKKNLKENIFYGKAYCDF